MFVDQGERNVREKLEGTLDKFRLMCLARSIAEIRTHRDYWSDLRAPQLGKMRRVSLFCVYNLII